MTSVLRDCVQEDLEAASSALQTCKRHLERTTRRLNASVHYDLAALTVRDTANLQEQIAILETHILPCCRQPRKAA